MNIQPIINYTQQRTNFKKGLTSYEINAVKQMKPFEYLDIAEKLKKMYNMEANFKGSNTVAWCVKEVAEIMTKAGFKLPKQVDFCLIDENEKNPPLGVYYSSSDKVAINSYYKQFNNLIDQNILEEYQGNYHPVTRHFLQTYLHEFSHAAHFHNLCDKLGTYDAQNLFGGIMRQHTPHEYIVGPLNHTLRELLPKHFKKIINRVFPPTEVIYALKNLLEYFAEKNSRYLAQQLGNSYIKSNIKDNFASSYTQHPADWNMSRKLVDICRNHWDTITNGTNYSFFDTFESVFESTLVSIGKVVDLCNQEIKYTDGDIYHGNMTNLERKVYIK